MQMTAVCRQCGQSYLVDASLQGQTLSCAGCSSPFEVAWTAPPASACAPLSSRLDELAPLDELDEFPSPLAGAPTATEPNP